MIDPMRKAVAIRISAIALSTVAASFAYVPRVTAQAAIPQPILAFEATPIGALPPMALPMPASRDHNYWGLRFQTGERVQRGAEDLLAVATGVDFQVRGGSVFGLTGGYQWRQHCQAPSSDCGGHSLFGARARFSVMTGGPTLASLWGDNDASSTLGTEIGIGYAPRTAPGVNACTLDVGLPFSIATLERIHLVTFLTPGWVKEFDCSSENTPSQSNYLMGFGLGLQQLGFRGVDVQAGMQRVFRGTTGVQFGISISWVRLP